MRALGYPRPISMENFRSPNFDLVADVLHWLVKRYEPTADMSEGSPANMQDRVIFLKKAAQLMQTKGRIKLNTKRLYQADGYAVKELIKIAQVLYSAIKSNPEEDDDVLGSDNFSVKLDDLQNVRKFASEITAHGVQLAELLGKEDVLRQARERAVSRDTGAADVPRLINDYIEQAKETAATKEKQMKELRQDEEAVAKKLDKKRAELERNRKRLDSLKTVRPAFMNEYEELEEQLQDLFRDYLERYRNLDFIEHQLEEYNKKERELKEEHEREMKAMQKKIKDEEMKVLRGDVQLDENELDDSLFDDAGSGSSDDEGGGFRGGGGYGGRGAAPERPKTKSGARANVHGSLAGGGAASDDESDGSDSLSVRSGESRELLDGDAETGSGSTGFSDRTGSSGSDTGSGSGSLNQSDDDDF